MNHIIKCLAVALFVVFLFSTGRVEASGECAVSQNVGQCVCHNYSDSSYKEICPSESGIVSGHDCHAADYCCFPSPLDPAPDYCNFPTLDCNDVNEGGVQDTFGKCNGCGNGLLEIKEGCCDPDIDDNCTDPANYCEECDDSENVTGTNNCDENCQLEACGNGIIEANEQCDGQALGNCAACTSDCACCPDADQNGSCDRCVTAEDCPSGDACTTTSCVNNLCVNSPVACSDGNTCTDDSCDPESGCVYTDIEGDSCDTPGFGTNANPTVGGCSLAGFSQSGGAQTLFLLTGLSLFGALLFRNFRARF